MSISCSCDYSAPEFYILETPTARKEHRCEECGCAIHAGEKYERVRAKWEGAVATVKTCPDCVEIRDALKEMECFCWSHGGLWEDIRGQFENAYFSPALRFNYLRIVAGHRWNTRQKDLAHHNSQEGKLK